MQIHLHVGVHKTATTHMQLRLAKSRSALTAAGVAYMPLEPFRSLFTSRLIKLVPGEFSVDDHAEKFFFDGKRRKIDRLLISDENLVGWCGSMFGSGIPFKGAVSRLEQLRQLFPAANITLFCSIRSYDTFITAAYCEALRNGAKFMKFRRFWDRIDFDRLRWPRVIDGFIGAIQPNQTKIWKYEDFRANSSAILRDLAFGVDVSELAEDAGGRPSFSQVTVELLELIAAFKGGKVASRLIRPIGDGLPKSEGYGQFDPWSNSERKLLTEHYNEDCKSIDPSLWLLAPDHVSRGATSEVVTSEVGT